MLAEVTASGCLLPLPESFQPHGSKIIRKAWNLYISKKKLGPERKRKAPKTFLVPEVVVLKRPKVESSKAKKRYHPYFDIRSLL
jgi:hypothetical protein